MRKTILQIFLLPIVLFSCDSNSQPEKSIESTITNFLIEVQKHDGEDDLDYTMLSSFIITNEEYKNIHGQLDFKSYEDYQENLGDELADIFIEAEELSIDFRNIDKLKFESLWDEKEKVQDGQCITKIKGRNETYELDAHLIKIDDNWKIIYIEDLTSDSERTQKEKPNLIQGE